MMEVVVSYCWCLCPGNDIQSLLWLSCILGLVVQRPLMRGYCSWFPSSSHESHVEMSDVCPPGRSRRPAHRQPFQHVLPSKPGTCMTKKSDLYWGKNHTKSTETDRWNRSNFAAGYFSGILTLHIIFYCYFLFFCLCFMLIIQLFHKSNISLYHFLGQKSI